MLRIMKSMQITPNVGSRRRYTSRLLIGLCCLSLCGGCDVQESRAAERTISWASSLVTDAESSRDLELPIVVFITQQGCRFCVALRRQVLYPMIRAGELSDKAIIREVSLDSGFALEDFSGVSVSGRQFANRYAAALTPTLLFLDAGGVEIAEKKVGISNIEYYGFYLLKSLSTARERLKRTPEPGNID